MGARVGGLQNSMDDAEPLKPGNLRGCDWQRFLRGPDEEVLEKLYVPALSESVRYDRCCSYFSSSVLSAAARGFAGLIRRLEAQDPPADCAPIRLLVNEELSEADVDALTETGDLHALERHLNKRFKTPKEALEKDRLAMLAWLVKKGLMQMRVGLMRSGGGILHAKFGIMTDEAGDSIVFRGSGNESARALAGNFEQLEVSTSWEDPDAHSKHSSDFEAIWQNDDPHVLSVPLPEALEAKLIKFAPEEPPLIEPSSSLERQRAAMVWQFIAAAPYLPNGQLACDATAMVDFWPHQRHVVAETAAAWPSGRLLCDEVGMGKTIEAIGVLRRLLAGRGVRRVLILLPAGLMNQWQAELREKGGLIVPRWEPNRLIWPDGRTQDMNLAAALDEERVIVSRETARTDNNLPVVLRAQPWDLVLLDESHAARRKQPEEGEFNAGNLLLNMLRELQLKQKARGFLLLSATPMQTHPWEPWDLLSILGEGGHWLCEFPIVRDYYTGVAALGDGSCTRALALQCADTITCDPFFPKPPDETWDVTNAAKLADRLCFVNRHRRGELTKWMRKGSPLARRMHRNTRHTLMHYHERGLLDRKPPLRSVRDKSFDYEDPKEREVYNDIRRYIERRFDELEQEKPGKGFVMTVYRRRAVSSPHALERSLAKRADGLKRVIESHARDNFLDRLDQPERLDDDDLPDPDAGARIPSGLPETAQGAKKELADVRDLLEKVKALKNDTKVAKFFDILRELTEDGRSVLVFTDYTDTMEYLRDRLKPAYEERLACFSGAGGQRYDGERWVNVGKDAITAALAKGDIRVLICTDAASEGLNLQAAGAVINYDLPWNPAKVEQRIGRVDRIGQKLSTVYVVNMFLSHSVDEQVYTALRLRCGLFEHFVGSMQPVLSEAAHILRTGRASGISDLIAAAAQRAKQDLLSSEAYFDSEAEPDTKAVPPVTLADLQAAMGQLDGELPIRARKEGGVWQVTGFGRKLRASCDVTTLEADAKLVPLVPEQDFVQGIASRLSGDGKLLPLVIGTCSDGAFRISLAYWVGGGKPVKLRSMADLKKKLAEWCGDRPTPEALLDARQKAEREAKKVVRAMQNRCKDAERAALDAQLTAAKERLVRELGKSLVALGYGTASLNAGFYEEMKAESPTAERLRAVYKHLGRYPDWPEQLQRELEEFNSKLTEGRRTARRTGSELDAALQDPRWVARKSHA